MFAQRVRPDELIDLLAAESYDPVLMEYCSHTLKSPKLEGFLSDKARLGVTGTIAKAYVSEGTDAAVPYLTTKQVSGLYAHLDGCKYITAGADKAWAKCRVPDGAIVLNKSGNVGAAAIVACAPYSYVNTVSDIINIRPRRPGVDGKGRAIDSGYLVVFLNSPFGQSQFQRLSGGAVFDHVSLYAVPEIRIFEPSVQAQRYIGDKVRLAERLRERARSLRREIDDQLALAALVAALGTTEQRANRVSASELNPRLDSKYYGNRSMAVLHAAAANGVSIGSLVEEVSNGFEHRDFAANGTPYITVTEVSGGRLVLGTAPRLGADVSIPNKARLDTRCVLVVRTGSIGVAVPVFDEDTHASIGSDLIRLRFRTEKEAAAVAAFLNSEAGRVLQRKISFGAVQPHIGQDELLALPIPKTLLDSAESILKLLTTEDAALRAAQRLTSTATTLVEHLIEGKVTEADFVAAQKALESGERSCDRAILQTLRRNGNPLQPIIPDLDGLYALLDELDAEVAQ
jgi:type I restriction enzyme S subunit